MGLVGFDQGIQSYLSSPTHAMPHDARKFSKVVHLKTDIAHLGLRIAATACNVACFYEIGSMGCYHPFGELRSGSTMALTNIIGTVFIAQTPYFSF